MDTENIYGSTQEGFSTSRKAAAEERRRKKGIQKKDINEEE